MAIPELNNEEMRELRAFWTFEKPEKLKPIYWDHEHKELKLPLLRATFPRLIAEEIVNVQPMTNIDFEETARAIATLFERRSDPMEDLLKSILKDMDEMEL